jgi:hypothetical protein
MASAAGLGFPVDRTGTEVRWSLLAGDHWLPSAEWLKAD